MWAECPLPPSTAVCRNLNRASAVTYEPIIRYAPIIVPLILVCGVAAATIYRPPQPSNASGYVATKGCVGVGPECAR
jgi:hypothetical protein